MRSTQRQAGWIDEACARAGGDGHQEQAQQERPERDAVGLRQLALGHAGEAAGRRGTAR